MKKIITTIAIVIGLCLTSFANPNGGGMFGRGESANTRDDGLFTPALPQHGQTGNQPAPLGSGIAVLTAFGIAYLFGKRHHEE
jgi:hypothetical protein